MAFNKELIIGNISHTPFPMDLILEDTYDITPDMRSELKAFRDNFNYLNRITSPNFKTKITFQTAEMTESNMQRIRQWLSANTVNSIESALLLTVYNPKTGEYMNINMAYKADETYRIETIDQKRNNIKYGKITWTFIQY